MDRQNNNKMVSMDYPLRAFQVILANADIEFMEKLGRLLSYTHHVAVEATPKREELFIEQD